MERERGDHEAREAERQRLLNAAIPVLLRAITQRGRAEDEARAKVLDALHKLAINPSAVGALLRYDALNLTLALFAAWPIDSTLVSLII